MAYVLLWHERNNDDPGHRWMRQLIGDSMSSKKTA
jgi:hypothetical protein